MDFSAAPKTKELETNESKLQRKGTMSEMNQEQYQPPLLNLDEIED